MDYKIILIHLFFSEIQCSEVPSVPNAEASSNTTDVFTTVQFTCLHLDHRFKFGSPTCTIQVRFWKKIYVTKSIRDTK